MNKFLKIPAWVIFSPLMISMLIGVRNNSLGMILSGTLLGLWILLMGLATRNHNPLELRFSSSFFVFRILFFTIYIIIASSFFGYDIPKLAIPFHIIATIFIFSCLATCAKTILIAETHKEKSFIDSLGLFLLLWFFPIGIWFVQPRLNALYESRKGI